jgi:hypothetical protein
MSSIPTCDFCKEILIPSNSSFPEEESKIFANLHWVLKLRANEALKIIDFEKVLQYHRNAKNNFLTDVFYSCDASNAGVRLVGLYDVKNCLSYWGVWFGKMLQGPRRRVHGGAIGCAIESCFNTHTFLQQSIQNSRNVGFFSSHTISRFSFVGSFNARILSLTVNYKKGVRICTPYLLKIHHIKNEDQKIFLKGYIVEPSNIEGHEQIYVDAVAISLIQPQSFFQLSKL